MAERGFVQSGILIRPIRIIRPSNPEGEDGPAGVVPAADPGWRIAEGKTGYVVNGEPKKDRMHETESNAGAALPESAKVKVDILADPTVSYASYQNNVPLIRSLTLANATDEPLRDVEIVVRCEPVFADASRSRIALVAGGGGESAAPGS